ncbi:hypothetical protein BHE74_00000816 [Ensete ventricosum]|nr:hypothetical protein BHE74_00000816 [Ensete ventricosum]
MAVRIRLQLALDHSLPVAIFPIWSLFKAIIAAPYSSDRSSWRSTCEWWVKVYGQFKELSSVQSTRGRGHIRLLVHAYLCGATLCTTVVSMRQETTFLPSSHAWIEGSSSLSLSLSLSR